jgi:hypothetical protein
MAGGEESSSLGYRALNAKSFFLHNLEVERSSFCKLMMKDMTHWRWVMMAQLGRSSMMMGAASSGTPAPRSAPTTAAWVGAPPPCAESTQEALARWIDSGGGLVLS